MTIRTFAIALSGREKYQKGKGKNTLDDLDKIAEAFETNKANLLRNLNNQNILIQMKELEVQYSLVQGGYIQATYQVYNQTTKEEK
jgi:hypothetical protein